MRVGLPACWYYHWFCGTHPNQITGITHWIKSRILVFSVYVVDNDIVNSKLPLIRRQGLDPPRNNPGGGGNTPSKNSLARVASQISSYGLNNKILKKRTSPMYRIGDTNAAHYHQTYHQTYVWEMSVELPSTALHSWATLKRCHVWVVWGGGQVQACSKRRRGFAWPRLFPKGWALQTWSRRELNAKPTCTKRKHQNSCGNSNGRTWEVRITLESIVQSSTQ